MPTATKPAAASGTRTSSSSRAGAKAAAADTGLVRERASYWRSQGLTDTEVRSELRDEGFKSADIGSALGSTSSDVDASPASEPPPASSSATPAGGGKSRRSAASSKRGSVGLGPLRVSTPGTPAGMLLAVVAYPAVLAYLTGGTPGLKAWFRAKFLNQTSTDPGIRNEAFLAPSQLFGGSGANATPTAALSTYGRPRQHASTPAPKTSDALPPNASGPNSYNAITGTWGDASGAASARGARAVAFARAQLGDPYKWGGTGPDKWDCSGLAQAAWHAAGVRIPRTTGLQLLTGRRVAKRKLIPGDLVFPLSGHVQIFAGSGQVIEAPRTGLRVRVAPLGRVLTARRPG